MRSRPSAAIAVTVVLLAMVAIGSRAAAEPYPSRPVTLIVPFAAGSIADLVARILAEPMRLTLGQPLIVENVVGAGGTIGVGKAARAAPDGYTLSIGDLTSHVSSAAIFPIKYDVLRDFAPVALLSSAPQLLVGRRDLEANDLRELIAWLKANPDKAAMALPNAVGSGGHLTGLAFQSVTGTRFQFVPYRGSPQAVQDLIGGHVDLLFTDAANVLPYVRSGQIRAYGVTTKGRWTSAPEIPAIEEFGVPVYFTLWRGLWAPAGTPQDIIEKLNGAVVDALADPRVRVRLAELGNDIPLREQQTPEALRAHHMAEIQKWWPIIKAAHIKAD